MRWTEAIQEGRDWEDVHGASQKAEELTLREEGEDERKKERQGMAKRDTKDEGQRNENKIEEE